MWIYGMGFGGWSWISVKAGLSLCYVNFVQYYGFMLYRTTLPRNVPEPTPLISPLNGIHDRAYVSVNGVSRPLVWVTLTQCFVLAMVSQTLQQCVLPKTTVCSLKVHSVIYVLMYTFVHLKKGIINLKICLKQCTLT